MPYPPLRRRTLLTTALLGIAPAFGAEAALRIVVGFPAGASSDILARMLAETMGRALDRPAIVENRAGAGTRISAELVKNAPADGLTLLLAPVATMAIFPSTYAGELRYDPFRDFTPVAHLANYQIGLGIGAHVPAASLADYVRWVQADPVRNGFYGITAAGSLPHLLATAFGKAAGLALTPVPFKGAADSMQALATGQIGALWTVLSDLQPLVDARIARVLAVAGAQRSPPFGSVPTLREQGVDLVASGWYGLFAPAGTPAATVQRLSRAAVAAVTTAEHHQRLQSMGLEPTGEGPERLAEVLRADHARWALISRSLQLKPS